MFQELCWRARVRWKVIFFVMRIWMKYRYMYTGMLYGKRFVFINTYKRAPCKLFNMILMIDWIIPTQSHVIISSHLSLVNCGKWFFYSTFIECSISIIMIIIIVVAISDDKHKSKKERAVVVVVVDGIKKVMEWERERLLNKWRWTKHKKKMIEETRNLSVMWWWWWWIRTMKEDEDVICWCWDEMTAVMMKKEM